MEMVACVSAVVQVALTVSDKVLKYIGERGDNNPKSKQEVELLKSLLSTFQSFIKDHEHEALTPQDHKNVTGNLVDKIVKATKDIEDALDEFMRAVPTHTRSNMLTQSLLHGVIDRRHVRKLSSRREKIKAFVESEKLLDHLHVESTKPRRRFEDPATHQFLVDEGIVGFTKRKQDLAQQLIGGDSKRATIEVVGPGGSGKTFLVKNVCDSIRSRFHSYAWINMSRSFDADADREIWQKDLLDQICPQSERHILDREAGNTPQKLRSCLECKRYLVVLDNVWSKQAYTPIVNSLPNNHTGSRIILTSRKSHVVDNPEHSHTLDGLIEDEALSLFLSRAIRDHRQRSACPPQLIEISKKILRKCDGLPLAIAAAGSLLSEKPLVERDWDSFLQNLGSEFRRNSKFPIVTSILESSFYDLPGHLRSCFLYFSIFPEDQAVSRGRLIHSWIAEEFIPEIDGKTPEEVAESSLNELVGRSLVRVCSSEIDGRVRSCQLRKLHHEFIVPLSKKHNFITVLDDKPKLYSSPNMKFRRISVQGNRFPKPDDMRHVRTLFVFNMTDVLPKNCSIRAALRSKLKQRKDVGSLHGSLESGSLRCAVKNKMTRKGDDEYWREGLSVSNMLRVVDFQGMPLHKLDEDFGSRFSFLKCLNLRNTKVKTVPESVAKLTSLETLDLKYTLVQKLPKEIVKLRKLRHLLVSWRNGPFGIEQGTAISSPGIGALSSLQSLTLIQVNYNQTLLFKDLERLVQIRTLGLIGVDEDCGKELCKSIEKMESLSKLDLAAKPEKYLKLDHNECLPKYIQCLRLMGRLRSFPSWVSSLSSLVKVALKGSKLSAQTNNNPLSGLEALPSLMELEMVDYYAGEALVFKKETFTNLRKLHVEQFENLSVVVLEEMALIKLENLTICKCKKLEPLPRSYPLWRLEVLVVYEMSGDFLFDIQKRIAAGELVDHIQDDTASGKQIQSYRQVS